MSRGESSTEYHARPSRKRRWKSFYESDTVHLIDEPTWNAYRQMYYKTDTVAYRGIGITFDWDDFKTFLRDMGPKPKGMVLSRKDKSKDFCKENCEWVSKAQSNKGIV